MTDVADVIRKDLTIIPPEDSDNRATARRIAAGYAVAVHVRWFEGPETSHLEYNVGSSYYARTVGEILERVADPHFFLFSDRPDAAQPMLDRPDDKVTCVSHNRGDENAYADLG